MSRLEKVAYQLTSSPLLVAQWLLLLVVPLLLLLLHYYAFTLSATSRKALPCGGGLMLLRLGAVPTLVMSSPRAAQAIMRTHDHVFTSRAGSTASDDGSSDIIFSPYGRLESSSPHTCSM
jgi:hypothetical protein